MDASSSFTSPRLRIVRRQTRLRSELTPRELAQLLFDEINDMDYHIFDLLFESSATGFSIDAGRRTISYDWLTITKGSYAHITSSSLPIVPDTRFYDDFGRGNRNHMWGLLVVRREDRAILWIKARELQRSHEDIELDPESLADLMELHAGEQFSVLNGVAVYSKLVSLVIHKANYYSGLSNNLLVYAAGLQESHRILHEPARN